MIDADRPLPLVPADVDLRNFPDMWFDVDRLLESETWVMGNGDERAAAFTLWAKSWHQVPAGSLPSDPRMLEHLSMSKRWKACSKHALRGWISCSDGRLYHPVVCERALEAWVEKLVSSLSGAIGNSKRWNLDIDLDHMRGQLLQAVQLLRAMNPQSKQLKKKAVLAHIAAASAGASPPDQQNTSGGDMGNGSGADRNRPDQTRPDQTFLFQPPHGGSGAAHSAAPAPAPLPAFNGLNADVFPGKAIAALAADFQLPEDWGMDAEALGFRTQEVIRQAERFRQYWVAGNGKGKRRSVKGWRQTWSNWLEKAAGDRR